MLKTAFAKSGMTMEKLMKMSSGERSKFFKGILGDLEGKAVNVLFEKALVSNQKQAISNWAWKQFTGHQPLYKDITIPQSKAMVDGGLTVKGLKDMSSANRIAELSKYVDLKTADKLNTRFENSIKSGTLKNWEEKTLGTDKMHADKQLKSTFAKIEALNDTGLLNPDQTEQFMSDLVSSKLGVGVTAEQSAKISNLITETSKSLEKITKLNDWTADNREGVVDYFVKRAELESYVKGLAGGDAVDIANDLVSTFRNNILGSPRIFRNSALYQIIPSIERFFTKRLISASIGDVDSTLIDKFAAKVSAGLFPGKEGADFIKRQIAMTLEIYHKTGYDISRMQTLYGDGPMFIGESEKVMGKMSVKDAVGFTAKTRAITNNIARVTGVFPKWMAGGTDTIIAAAARVETAVLWSNESAKMDAMKGRLPKGVTKEERAKQLRKESLNFTTEDAQADNIRNMGIMDADYSNNTQPDGLADFVVRLRDSMSIGGVKFGRLLVPFAKISTTTLSRGLQAAVPVSVARDLKGIYTASQTANPGERRKLFSKYVSSLIGTLGIIGSAVLISAFLDDDDYIPPFAIATQRERDMAKSRGGRLGSVRIGGKWIELRYLPLIGITLSSIMNARRVKARGGDYLGGYISGVLAQLVDIPGAREISDIQQKLKNTSKSEDIVNLLNKVGLDGEKIVEWAKVRVLPAFLSYDVYNAVFPKDANYDFLGRELDRGGTFRDDKTNRLLMEFSKLDKAGYGPTISPYTGKERDKAIDKMGEEAYNKKYAIFSRNYASRVRDLISQPYYRNMSNQEKKKAIDKIRDEEIVKNVKALNSETVYDVGDYQRSLRDIMK